MRSSGIVALSLGGFFALAGCGSDGLSAVMVGSYTRVDAAAGVPVSQRLRLELTPTGITVSTPPAAPAATGAGTPAPAAATPPGKSGAALFEKVSCSDETSCRFTTKNGCEGTLTRDVSGAVVVVAMGECESWSGKWSPAKDSDLVPPAAAPTVVASGEPSAAPTSVPVATVPGAIPTAPATASPTASPTATVSPTATASPSGTATSAAPSPTAPLNVSCLGKCNDANVTCIRNCKIGDFGCLKDCTTKVSDCSQRCP